MANDWAIKLDFDRLENINFIEFKITPRTGPDLGLLLYFCTYRPGGPHCCENWHIPSYFEFAVAFRGVNLQSENYKPFYLSCLQIIVKRTKLSNFDSTKTNLETFNSRPPTIFCLSDRISSFHNIFSIQLISLYYFLIYFFSGIFTFFSKKFRVVWQQERNDQRLDQSGPSRDSLDRFCRR